MIFFDVFYDLVYTTSNQKQFCFSEYDIYSIMNCLLQYILTRYNMRYEGSNIILNTGIGDNNDNVHIDCRFLENIIK